MRLLAVVVMVLLSVPARAALGGRAEEVASEAAALGAEVRRMDTARYTVHELGVPGGTVRELADPSGRVFAVAWRTEQMPDLRTLLGEHHAAFQAAKRPGARRRGPVVLRTEQLVVESGGHQRAFRGRAWLPALLPTSVTAEDIR